LNPSRSRSTPLVWRTLVIPSSGSGSHEWTHVTLMVGVAWPRYWASILICPRWGSSRVCDFWPPNGCRGIEKIESLKVENSLFRKWWYLWRRNTVIIRYIIISIYILTICFYINSSTKMSKKWILFWAIMILYSFYFRKPAIFTTCF